MKSAGKILIVDDSHESLGLLSAILESEGYSVRPADSGELALEAVSLSPPELILLDSRMPGLKGPEVCRRLKSRKESRDIPVIFLSASREFNDRLEALQAGAVDFINKPFHREELLARLATQLELARLRQNLEQRVAERTRELEITNEKLNSELEAHRKSEWELRESEHRFRSIADGTPAGIAVFDKAGRLIYAGKWIQTFLGIGLQELAEDGWFRAVHPDDAPGLYQEISSAVQEQRSSHVVHRLRRSDGEYRWMASTASPRFVSGEFAGHVVVSLDISEMRRAQEQALANQKLESLGVLAAGIAHEFNNLLSTVLAHSELALSEVPTGTPVHESVSTISTVALHAAEIVSQLMAYAGAADTGTPEPVDLSAVIHDMVKLLRVSVSRGASLELNLARNLPPVWVNPGRVRDVILVLVTNASEALMGQAGVVRISVAKETSGALPSGLNQGDYIVLEVSDTGCGMTEEVMSRIFDPFFSTKFIGRGLGLASSLGVVRGAGGAITVDSSPGQGSTFRVWLPCADPLARNNEPALSPAAAKRSGWILLVDDEDGLRLAASNALQREGYSVMVARDGTSAIDLIARHAHEVEVAVLDMALPGLSGLEVCRELRRLKPDVPVIFTSALKPDEARGPISERFLQKPYRLRELVHAIRDIMPPSGPIP